MQVGQQEQIAATARLALHSAHDLGKELSVEIWKNNADRIVARKAEAARARVRDIAQFLHRMKNALARFLAHIFKSVERTRHRCNGKFGPASDVTDGCFSHRAPYRLQLEEKSRDARLQLLDRWHM